VLLCGSARAPLAAIARALAAPGRPLLIQAAAPELAATRRLCRAVARTGAEARLIGAALGGVAESRRVVTEAWKAARSIESVVICPALPAIGASSGAALDAWQAGIEAGLRAPFFLAQQAARRMRRAGGGQLVFAIGGAARSDGALAAVLREGLLCMVAALAKALPAGVAVVAVVAGRRGPARGATAQIARSARALVADRSTASGTIVTLGEPPPRG
jgi:NAD(P)-dependent dehydrogenase (short-subunit alcohol dehydrogenase family)